MGEQERRKYRRMGLDSTITVRRVDGSDEEQVDIHIYNISKSGLGFCYDEPLQLNAIYDAKITIWTKEVITALIRIVRIDILEDSYDYGAAFLALSDIDAYRISVFEAVDKVKQEEGIKK